MLTELDIKKLGGADYPLLFADISSADIDRGTINYDVDIVVAELTVPGQTNALGAVQQHAPLAPRRGERVSTRTIVDKPSERRDECHEP